MRSSIPLVLAFAFGTIAALAPDGQAQQQQQQQQQQGQAPVTGAAPTQLLADDLTGMEGKEVLARRFEAPGGWASKKHYHSGHVLVYVLEGAITFEEEGRPAVTKKAGEMFHERPSIPLTARNASATEPVKLLVIDIKDKGQPVTADVQ